MKYERKETNDRSDESARTREETTSDPRTMFDGDAEPSQMSQKVPFSPPPKGEGKDEQIDRALEDRNAQFRREDKETNHSDDPRIGTHDREYE